MVVVWVDLVCAGCMLKYFISRNKKIFKDGFEMHGFCKPAVAASCSIIAPSTVGDGYRGLGKRLGYGTDAFVSRSPGSCSRLCDSVPECQYWIVHNSKGRGGDWVWLVSRAAGGRWRGWSIICVSVYIHDSYTFRF